MRLRAIFILLISFLSSGTFSQTREITGKIIDKDFNPVFFAKIFNVDTTLLTNVDNNGNFKLEIPFETKSLIIGSVSMEWQLINLKSNCDHLEIVLLANATYDFISAGKVDRLRKKQFKKLPGYFQNAFEKGVFKNDKPCYDRIFIPKKQRLKEIKRNRAKMPST